mmetsp:Transcript_19934/g.43480  ORF Transcript_19934/g.43480 Transcript_19934/m.43480 type:complete len:603 (-) Transcript_19934:385-2193(-)
MAQADTQKAELSRQSSPWDRQYSPGVPPSLVRGISPGVPMGEMDDPVPARGSVLGPELAWTGRFCGGLLADMKRRYPYMLSDWTDAFKGRNGQISVAAVLFLFFVVISPALAFGSLMSDSTDGQLGVVETILATAISGVLYSVLAGQPICIMGATGPEYAYTVVFFSLCKALDIEFLPARVWQGLWCSLFTVVLAMTDASAAMSHFTRFVEDIFSLLISLIFIVGAFQNLGKSFDKLSLEGAFLTALLCFGTYLLATWLRAMKRSTMTTPKIRDLIANFGVAISVLVFAGLAQIWRNDVDLEWLEVQGNFEPSWSNPATGKVRSWVVSPFGINKDFPVWAIFFCAIPAMGLAVLGFLDQNLTTIIVNRPASGLKKPTGYHLDLFWCGVFIYPICGFLGLPFTHNSTGPSLIHLMALTTYDDIPVPGGGTRKVASDVVEQRWTNFMVHVLCGAALAFGSVLQYVPKAVTFGIFLVMGVASLAGNQFFERLWLWSVWDRSAYPRYRYVTRVPFSSLHLYTLIQFICFAVLYTLTSISAVAVVFPFFMASLVFVRKSFVWLFTQEELEELDAHEDLPLDDDTDASLKPGDAVKTEQKKIDDSSSV